MMNRVVFIKNILLFSSDSPQRLIELSHVSSSWRDTVTSQPYSVASHVFYNSLLSQSTSSSTSSSSSSSSSSTDLYVLFESCVKVKLIWAVLNFLDAVVAVNKITNIITTKKFSLNFAWFNCAVCGSVELFYILNSWHRKHLGEADMMSVQSCNATAMLHQAAKYSNISFIDHLLRTWEHIDIDAAANQCLMAAVQYGQTDVVEFLLSGGKKRETDTAWFWVRRHWVTTDSQSGLEWTFLHEAIAYNSKDSAKTVRRLLTIRPLDSDYDFSNGTTTQQKEKSAIVNLFTKSKRLTSFLYAFAANQNNVEVMKALSENGIILQQNEPATHKLSRRHGPSDEHHLNLSALDESLIADSVDTFKFLIETRQDLFDIFSLKDDDTIGRPGNPILFASVVGSENVLRYLIYDNDKKYLMVKNDDKHNNDGEEGENKKQDLLKELVNERYYNDEWTALSLVSLRHMLQIVKEINTRTHWSAPRYSDLNLEHYSKDKRLRIIEMLIEAGADVNVRPFLTKDEDSHHQIIRDHDDGNNHQQHQQAPPIPPSPPTAAPFPLSSSPASSFPNNQNHHHHQGQSFLSSSSKIRTTSPHLLDQIVANYKASRSFFNFRSLPDAVENCPNTQNFYEKSKQKAMDSFEFKLLNLLMEKHKAGSPRIRNRTKRDAGFRFDKYAKESNLDPDDEDEDANNIDEQDLIERELFKKNCSCCSQTFSYFVARHICNLCNATCCSNCFSSSDEYHSNDFHDHQSDENDDNDRIKREQKLCKSCVTWISEK